MRSTLERPPTYSMLVHEAAPDGRFVVTNSCRFDIPTETNFLVLFAERGVIESGGN